MGAEATTSIGGVWARLEGQVVEGRFPLRRLLGSSEHSGVFLTESAKLAPSEVALKLVALPLARVESQLARWHTAAAFSHPNLMRLFDVGRCNVAGLGNLYGVMEYADQDLAQLLQRRALTEEEAREMLVPMLSALAFLHERKLVLGRLKPSNVLVVGDQLKLASDAIRPVGEVDDVKALSVYDPPEARDGICSTAGDVWALGVTLCEALTRRQPLGLLGGAGTVVLPPDLPPAFREIVAWCLRRQPQDRPDVAEIDAWLSGLAIEFGPAELKARAATNAANTGATAPASTASTVSMASAAAAASLASAASSAPTAGASAASPSPRTPEPTPAKSSALDVELAAGMDSPAPLQSAPAAPTAPSRASVLAAAAPATAPSAASALPNASTASRAAPPPTPTAPAASRPASAAPTVPAASKPASAAPSTTPPRPAAAPATSAPRAQAAAPAAAKAAPSAPVVEKYASAAARPASGQTKLASPAATPPPAGVPSAGAPSAAAAPASASKSKPVEPPPSAAITRARIDEGDVVVQPRRPLMPLALGVVVVIAVVWGGIRLFGAGPTPQPASEVVSAERPEASAAGQSTPSATTTQSTLPPESAPAAPPTNAKGHADARASANAKAATSGKPLANAKGLSNAKAIANAKAIGKTAHPAAAPGAQSVAIQQVLPDVPQRARRTIRGNVRVSVRVIVEQDGTVFAALAERRGPSRYFERLAIDAAKKWTFAPTDNAAQRLMLVTFAFNRDGTTAEAVPLM